MKKWIAWLLPFVILLAAGLAALWSLRTRPAPAPVGVPDTADSRLIEATIVKSYIIEAECSRTFDTSAYASVFVNDARGGAFPPSVVEFMQRVTGETTKTDFGYLDYSIEACTWDAKAIVALEDLWAKAAREGRDPTEQEMRAIEEMTGTGMIPGIPGAPYIPGIPAARYGSGGTPDLDFKSIVIDGDVAVAVYRDGGLTQESTLVRINGRWLIAAGRTLRVAV